MNIKCVLVGDSAVGKSCLLQAYTTGTFNENYRPTLFDNYRASVTLAGEQRVNLDLFDTSGTEKYDSLRQVSYQHANVVLVCFNLLSKSSFKNVKSKWMKEVEQFCPGTPVVLVGTNKDKIGRVEMFDEKGDGMVEVGKVEKYCKKLKNRIDFIQCSALTTENLKEVFDQAIVAGLESELCEKTSGKTFKKIKQKVGELIRSTFCGII